MAAIFPIFTNVFQRIKNVKLSEVLLVIILVTLPLGGFAINSSAVILFFLFSIYHFFLIKKEIYFSKITILLLSFYILCLLSLLWSNHLDNTKTGLVRFLSYLVLPIAFMFTSNRQFNKEKVLDVFSKSLVLYAIYCLVLGLKSSIIHTDLSYLFYHKLSGNLSGLNAIYFSVFISLGISFFINKQNKSKLDLFCLIFLALFLILLSSKIIILITFSTSLFYFINRIGFRKINFKSFFLIIIIASLFLLASSNLTNRIKVEFEKTKITEVLNKKDFGHVYLWTGFGLRVFQNKAFIEILQEKNNIILGSGLNNSQNLLIEKYKEYNLYPGFFYYNYHNQYLQVFAELGIVGLCLLLLILILIFKEAIIYKDYFLISFIILILVVCITESFLWRQRGMVFFLTIALLLTKRKKQII